MDVNEIRRKNLVALIKEHGGQKSLAELVRPTAPGYISQLVNGTRNVGGTTARRFEKQLGKPHGWMDQPHEKDSQSVAIAEETVPHASGSPPIDRQLLGKVFDIVNVYNDFLNESEQLDEIEKMSLIMDVYLVVLDRRLVRITTELIEESRKRLAG